MASPQFPEPPASVPATSKEKADEILAKLTKNKDAWAKLPIDDRIRFLKKVKDRTVEVAEKWSNAIAKAGGVRPESPLAGECWLSGPVTVVRNLRLSIESLQQGGQPRPAEMLKYNDRHIARIFPMNGLDKLMFTGFTADVWIEPGEKPTQGRIYREKDTKSGVSLVLGAGNISSIGPTDALYKLLVDNEVVILKMNPVNEYAGPFIELAFKPLIDAGYFAVVYGGAEIGRYLTAHEDVSSIHITGSEQTHDMIVWGETPEEQKKNKAAGKPVLDKEITSELGCVTPVLVVPGAWSDKEIAFQAEHVASMVAHNGSFDCNAAKVLITAKGWDLRDKFLDSFHAALARMPARKAYYPGAQKRYDGFLAKYPNHKVFGERSDEVVPWTAIPDVPANGEEYALNNEAFCGVIAEVAIDASDAESFLNEAVRFANEEVWGTLSCMVLIHPDTEKKNKATYDKAIANLRYGGIGVNCWAGVIFGLMSPTWGAHPGHTLDDIRSGRGVVHNTFMFDHPQKSVIKGPFVIKPTPAWFATHKNLQGLARKLLHMDSEPSYLKLPGLVGAALKG